MKQDLLLFIQDKKYQFSSMIEAFPELLDLKGIPQNPEWHGEGDVYNHTKLVCESLLTIQEWIDQNDRDKAMLYLAALFHDIGKRLTTIEEFGIISSPRHAVKGAKIFRKLFYKKHSDVFSLSFEEREEIVSLIRYHGLPLLFMEKENMEHYLIQAREQVRFSLLSVLAKADLLGRECKDKGNLLDMVDYFKVCARETGCYDEKYSFANPYARYKYFQHALSWSGADLYD